MQKFNNGLKQSLNELESQEQLQKTAPSRRQAELQEQNERWDNAVLEGFKKMSQDEEFRNEIDKNLS